MSRYEAADYMTVAMSRLIKEGERVFHGVASPMPAVAIQLAKRLHAPNAVYVSIAGSVDAVPAVFPESSTADPTLRTGGIAEFPLADIFDLSARGELDVAFLSGAQIDGKGRLNLSAIGTYRNPKVRLPGGAGSAALLPTVKRGILWKTSHDTRGLVEELDIVTAAGNTEAVLTPFGILKISGQDQRLRLYSLFPGIELEKAVLEMGFPLKLHESYEPFPEITEDEASLLQTLDSEGFRYREFE